ncbi:hypothetical protein NQZ68_002730 [Dissostichus eleginoides]|nr:hypothetical protein NQZ68_002730 [Dissostichus eleginoides]
MIGKNRPRTQKGTKDGLIGRGKWTSNYKGWHKALSEMSQSLLGSHTLRPRGYPRADPRYVWYATCTVRELGWRLVHPC